MPLQSINCERQMPPRQALEHFNTMIKNLPLQADYRFGGTKIKTYQCKLTNHEKNQIFFGCGKGIGIQSKVSASFEAYEHYLSYNTLTTKKNDNIIFSPSAKIKSLTNLLKLKLLPDNFITEESASTILPWLKYQSFSSDDDFYCPLFLIEPRYSRQSQFIEDKFDYDNFYYLADDTGTASGTSFLEAIIHALNECVERDATSIFLFKAFIEKEPITLIDKNTLPKHIKQYVKIIESEFQDNLAIIDISSDINIPTFCVAFTRQNLLIQPKGYGTSLNNIYALERALLEALQPLHLRTESLVKTEKQNVAQLENYPILKEASIANISNLVKKKQFILSAFKPRSICFKRTPLEQQLNIITDNIISNGFTPRYTLLSDTNAAVVCLKAIVPGFEKFHLVLDGKAIMPTDRCIKK